MMDDIGLTKEEYKNLKQEHQDVIQGNYYSLRHKNLTFLSFMKMNNEY